MQLPMSKTTDRLSLQKRLF